MWAVLGKSGLEPGLQSGPGADRDVQGGVRVAKGRSEDVGGPETSAGSEAGNIGLSGVIAGLGSSVNKCGDRVVAAGGLAQGAAGGVGGAHVSRDPVWQAAQGTGPGARRKRTEPTYSSSPSTEP